MIWLIVNLRLALGSVGDGRPIFTTQQGMEVALPGRQQLRTIALGDRDGAQRAHRALRLVAVGNVADLAQRGARSARPIRFSGVTCRFYVFTLPFLQFVRGLGADARRAGGAWRAARCTSCPAA